MLPSDPLIKNIFIPAALAARSTNNLLASLTDVDNERIRSHLHTIETTQGMVLVQAGDRLKRVYFPLSGVISLVVALSEGTTVQVAMVGRDSVLGASTALDGLIALTTSVVQLPGVVSTLEVRHLRKAAEESLAFRTTLIRHEQALFAQAQQSAACNISHTVEARLSGWLLRMRDLSGSDTLPLTQEFLAQLMGVQRNSVALVAQTLQQAGAIRYSRGHIAIINVDGLRDSSCECYATVKRKYERLLRQD